MAHTGSGMTNLMTKLIRKRQTYLRSCKKRKEKKKKSCNEAAIIFLRCYGFFSGKKKTKKLIFSA
jgi:hypothetical protein